jgi:hypothetical protein
MLAAVVFCNRTLQAQPVTHGFFYMCYTLQRISNNCKLIPNYKINAPFTCIISSNKVAATLNLTHINLKFMGPCIANTFQCISNKMQLYTVYLYSENALHVSGVTSTHQQERVQLYLQHLVFVRPLLLPAAIAADTCRYSGR